MIREKSAGVIVFRKHPKDGVQYLVLYHRGSYWNFPKGKMESGESEKKTALRELAEETGLTGVRLISGWRQITNFFFKEERNGKKELIKKDFVLYLGYAPTDSVVKISSEHNGYAWLDIRMAMKLLKFKSLKAILTEADSLITKKKGGDLHGRKDSR